MILEVLKGVADSIIATYEENKPEIMIYGGAIGLVVSGVAAAVVAYKARPEVDALKEEICAIEKAEQEGVIYHATNPEESIPYTTQDARKDKLGAVCRTFKRIGFKALIIFTLMVGSCIAIYGGVHEFERINKELVEEVAKLTATVAACENQLANKLGKEEALNAKYGQTDPNTGETKIVAPEEGRASDGTFFIKLDLLKCHDTFWNKDFDDRMALISSVRKDMELHALRYVDKYGACIIESWEIMQALGCKYGYDVDWRLAHKDMKYLFRRGDEINIDFGLDEAQELRDFERSPKDEVWLHINFNRGVVAPSSRVVKG